MMEGKVLSREILWCLSVDYIVEIVWGLPQRLVVRRKVLPCSERVRRQRGAGKILNHTPEKGKRHFSQANKDLGRRLQM